MIRFISHRGNLNGPNPEKENRPEYIDEAIRAGHIVEVDIRRVGTGIYLGHDYPQYKIDEKWIFDREDNLLLHCKDLYSAKFAAPSWHIFCHVNDPFTITSRGLVWQHDLSLATTVKTIVPLMTRDLVISFESRHLYGICSDYELDQEGRLKHNG